jgi:hypothetical protein
MALEDRAADKIIGFTGCIPADVTGAVPRPERRAAAPADPAGEPLCFKIVKLVFVFEHEKSRIVSTVDDEE